MGYSLEEEHLVRNAQLDDVRRQAAGPRPPSQMRQSWLAALLARLLDSGATPERRRLVRVHS